jgi:hypothetical protein
MGSGHSRGGSIGGVGTGCEYRDYSGCGLNVDLVEDAKVGSMNEGVSLLPLIFWALLSLTAVVASSWGPRTSVTATEVVAQNAASATATPMRWVPPQRSMPTPPPGLFSPTPGAAGGASTAVPGGFTSSAPIQLNANPPTVMGMRRGAPNFNWAVRTPNPPIPLPGVIPNQPPMKN